MVLWLRTYRVRFELNSNSSRSQHFFEKEVRWWAHRATIQVGAKLRNMRETYQVALLGLYRGYWWYISSLPYERAVMQRGASPNSSGDLNSSICLQDKFYQKEMWAQQKHIIIKHRFRMNNNPIRCFLIAQEFFMQKILSFFKIEKQNEKIHHFNPPCPPCPARHKGRNSKSI